jgi:predicted deacylase
MVSAIAVGLVLLAAADPRAAPYADHMLVEIDVPDAAAMRRLLATGVDPWLEHPQPGRVPVLVSPDERAMLWADGWSLRIVSVDVQGAIDAEADRLAMRPPVQHGVDEFFTDFREGDEIDAELDALVLASPELVTSYDIGMSIEGRTIRAIRVTADGADDRPAVVITAGQHAREWIAVSSGMYVIDQLVQRADEPEVAAMLEAVQVFVIPIVNPDGYAFSWAGDRYWRKNRRDGVGVDTNRNFAHGWGGEGASPNPEDGNYAGTAAFSEPESAAVRDFVQGHAELVAHLDLHSYGQLVLYPWGDVFQAAPDDAALAATADAIAGEMELFGTSYTALQGVALYPAAGNAIDWTYGAAGLHAITMELRPADEEVNFILPPEQIVPVGDEVMAGLWVLLEFASNGVVDPTGGDESTSDGGSSTGDGSSSSSSGGASTTTSATTDPSGGATTSAQTTALGDSSGDLGTSGDAGAADDAQGCGCDVKTPRTSMLGAALFVLFAARRRR